MQPQKIQGIIFDLDGTLIDSYQAIYLSFRHVYESMGLRPLSYEEVKREIGLGLSRTFGDLLGEEKVAEALRAFDEKYQQVMDHHTFLLPDARQVLEELHRLGVKMAIATNKIGRYSRRIIKNFGLDGIFSAILGDEDVTRNKPHPEMIFRAIEKMAILKEEAVMVGDSLVDLETARNAGIAAFAIPTGVTPREDLEKARPTRMLSRLADLLPIVRSSIPGRPHPISI